MSALLWVLGFIAATVAELILVAVAIATVRALSQRLHNNSVLDAVASGVLTGNQARELLTPGAVARQEAQIAEESWIHRILVAFDQFMNVLVFRGWPDETISAHSQRAAAQGKLWGRVMEWWLDMIQPYHGQKAEAGDAERAEAVENLEDKQLDVKPQ